MQVLFSLRNEITEYYIMKWLCVHACMSLCPDIFIHFYSCAVLFMRVRIDFSNVYVHLIDCFYRTFGLTLSGKKNDQGIMRTNVMSKINWTLPK